MNNLIRRTNKNDLDFFDDFFEGFFGTPVSRPINGCMKTDIKETEKTYDLVIDVPGFAKDEIKISLENGYLNVEANRKKETEVKEAHFLRRERFTDNSARSFFIGEDIAQEDIKASYDNGTLILSVPKQGTLVKEKKFISIE